MRADIPAGDGLWQEVEIRIVQVPLRETDLEALRGEGDAWHVLKAGQGVALGDCDVEAVEERREEQEQFHPGEDVAKAHSPTWTQKGVVKIRYWR